MPTTSQTATTSDSSSPRSRGHEMGSVCLQRGRNAKRVAVGVVDAAFAAAPWLIGRRPRDRQACLHRNRVRLIDLCRCLHPPAHPYATVILVAGLARRPAARTLGAAAQENLEVAACDGRENSGPVGVAIRRALDHPAGIE